MTNDTIIKLKTPEAGGGGALTTLPGTGAQSPIAEAVEAEPAVFLDAFSVNGWVMHSKLWSAMATLPKRAKRGASRAITHP